MTLKQMIETLNDEQKKLLAETINNSGYISLEITLNANNKKVGGFEYNPFIDEYREENKDLYEILESWARKYALESAIKATLNGVYKIEHSADGTHIYTKNCFVDSTTLKSWLNTFKKYGIVNIVVGYRLDRKYGLIYTLQREEQIGL